MKNSLLSCCFLLLCFLGSTLQAQNAELEYQRPSPFTGYSSDNFNVCGNPPTRKFRVSYEHCPGVVIIGGNCINGCGGNPIRYTVTFTRNGSPISSHTFQASSDWFRTDFNNVLATPGNYRASILVEGRKGLCIGWKTIGTYYTNTITVGTTPNVANFDINGNNINNSPLTVCGSNIRVNAAASSCETAYFIAVEESDPYWNRTYDYEWGRWFSGQAPNNINLQALSATYSVAPYYTGDPARQGQILIGGNLPNGQARHYRVKVCTGPTWNCKTALIKVNPNCRVDLSTLTPDNNTYEWVEEDNSTKENITVQIEAEYDKTALVTEQPYPIHISPNPLQQTATIQVEGYAGNTPITFELYNSLGERVLVQQSKQATFELKRGNLAAGIYVYRAFVGETVLGTGKLSIQ